MNNNHRTANALRSCLCNVNNELSFENIHNNFMKCTPKQIMTYQLSLKLFKALNEHKLCLSSDQVTVIQNLNLALSLL